MSSGLEGDAAAEEIMASVVNGAWRGKKSKEEAQKDKYHKPGYNPHLKKSSTREAISEVDRLRNELDNVKSERRRWGKESRARVEREFEKCTLERERILKDYSKVNHRVEVGGPRARHKQKLEEALDKVEGDLSHLRKIRGALI